MQSLVVTTSHKARPATRQHARTFSEQWQLDFVDRDDQPLEALLETFDAALVVTNNDKQLATADGILKSHLGTAFIRLKTLSRNEGDPLIRAGELQPGDHIVDTTFGLGRDAVIAACAVGPTGSVFGLESSLPLFHLARHGLADGPFSPAQITTEFGLRPAPTTIAHADAREWLTSQPTDSADVIYVDPMFSTPKTSDAGFGILRSVADLTALDKGWVTEAKRVARRWVVVKCGPSQPWFQAVGLEPVQSHSNANWWRTSG